MIPVSLSLKNFLSYGENVPPLDFTEFDIACLSGNNGHGKSAILDALTWALWGEARKAIGERSPEDGLLRIGATDMEVELVFDLEGDRYRVLRKYQRKKTRRSPILELQLFDEGSQGYKSLTEKTLKDTQDKINRILRMNYDTFINSAFILQGRVDEFTKRNPTQRKAILAEILDLSRYEALRELARGHYREAESQLKVLAKQLEMLHAELAHKGEYEQRLRELQQQLTALDDTLAQQERQKQDLEQQRTELQGKQQQLKDQKQRQEQLRGECERLDLKITRQEEELANVNATLRQEKAILAAYRQYVNLEAKKSAWEEKLRQTTTCQEQQRPLEQAIQVAQHTLEKELEKFKTEDAQIQKILQETQQFLANAQEIERGFQEFQACQAQDERWEEQRNQFTALERAVRPLEQAIAAQRHQLDGQLQVLEHRLAELQKIAGKHAANAQKVQICREAAAQLELFEKQLETTKEAGLEWKTRLDRQEAQKNDLAAQQQELAQKVELLKQSATPQCPVCKSDLDPQKKADLESHFEAEQRRLQQQAEQTAQTIQAAKIQKEELTAQYKRLKTQIEKLAKSREQLNVAEHALQESGNAREQLGALTVQADKLRAQLQDKAYAPAEQQQLAELHRQKERLEYAPQAHQTLKQRLKGLEKFVGEYSRLADVRRRQDEAAARLPNIHEELKRLRTMLARQDYAYAEQTKLQELLVQIRVIGYDEQAHTQIRQEFQRVQNAPTQKAELDQAYKNIGIFCQRRDELMEERRQKAERIAELNTQMLEFGQEVAEKLPAVQRELKEIESTLQTLRRQRDEIIQARGTNQSKYDHCQELAPEFARQQEQQRQTEKERLIYEHLLKIFGKDGIQAYLIENAIPDIEEETNALLSRLTDHRTAIAIESVKDTQSGGTRETLDIKISDELGTRSYEMYSGGEAFRVDFAIRVALSKLLATRAGTKLRTLVIDEGFGTQDARGLEQLVEAIKAIRTDFEKILVITHLDALKDAFPVRIEVVKYPETGSQYQIVH